ncbi:phage repressor protein CI [Enterobacter mori]|uniref:phage repressor protein CI n=1 Tax=Enterobacter mori TaxID=539813 RepID=UPI001C6799C7|nr:phage repressor protein CI [Enterobacter mori]MBW8249040.1 helix-turn-helix domain-containing protein [Enterobacter mori]MBW8254265.1 helix-turn-helix domain-containing protein [Enterobacter mori]
MQNYNIKTGARKDVARICKVYGFSSRLQLAQYLEMSPSALGTRIMRDNFPADLVLRCALETGSSIYWLTTGEGATFDHLASDTVRIPAYNIISNELLRQPSYIFDKVILPNYIGKLQIVKDDKIIYFVDFATHQVSDGKYLIACSGTKSIKELPLLPSNKLRIDWGKYPVDCDVTDVTLLGKLVAIYLVNE